MERGDVASQDELKNVTIRTRTGELFYFDSAVVFGDSLRGKAQETQTVYLEGGGVSELSVDRTVKVSVDDIEQMTIRKTNWGKTALLFLGVVGGVALITLAASSGGDDPVDPGDGSGGGKPPPPAFTPTRPAHGSP